MVLLLWHWLHLIVSLWFTLSLNTNLLRDMKIHEDNPAFHTNWKLTQREDSRLLSKTHGPCCQTLASLHDDFNPGPFTSTEPSSSPVAFWPLFRDSVTATQGQSLSCSLQLLHVFKTSDTWVTLHYQVPLPAWDAVLAPSAPKLLCDD